MAPHGCRSTLARGKIRLLADGGDAPTLAIGTSLLRVRRVHLLDGILNADAACREGVVEHLGEHFLRLSFHHLRGRAKIELGALARRAELLEVRGVRPAYLG